MNRVRVLLAFDEQEPLASGTPLLANAGECGFVTRSAFSPALQSAIGMAYVRRENSALGSELATGSGKARVIAPPIGARG